MKPFVRGLPLRLRGAAAVFLAGALCAPAAASASAGSEEDATIVHVLGRLSWGARPGDIAALRAMGLDAWIERQLHPERIDDTASARALVALPTLSLPPSQLLARYELPREVRQEMRARRAQLESASEVERRGVRQELMAKYVSRMDGTPRDVLDALQAGKVLRAATTERQLDDVLVDFWMNHFNVYAKKGPLRFLTADYERTVRAHAWGCFEDLLVATAKSPAMLFYLDNWLSTDPTAAERLGREHERRRMARNDGRNAQQKHAKRAGLNENYARELMELHTLGVDGGYTQKDVSEVARAFTGWTIRGLREDRPEFVFDARRHDPGGKTVLGQAIRGAGEEEGLLILHRLATQPSTARLIATKLARRFVSDEPPATLVDRVAEVFLKTRGDIRELVRTVAASPELRAPAARAAKVKTPLEFVVSAVRASGANVTDAHELARRIAGMGMPLYGQQPPTGYKDTAEAWVSTGALVARLNFALDLAAGRVPGVALPAASAAGPPMDPAAASDAVVARLLPAGLSAATRQAIEAEARGGLSAARLAGLVLGSPEFQRR
jgi:uncharacterized protein (DUF1800 family)